MRLVFRSSVSRDTDVVCIDIEQGFGHQASMAEASGSWLLAWTSWTGRLPTLFLQGTDEFADVLDEIRLPVNEI